MSTSPTRRELTRIRAAEAKRYVEVDGASLRRASAKAHTDPRTVLRAFPEGFKRVGRRWVAVPDRAPFEMRIVSTKGVVVRTTRGSNARSVVSRHHNAVSAYLRRDGGDPTVFNPFVGKRVAGVVLETDPEAILELWLQGQLDFLEIYVTR